MKRSPAMRRSSLPRLAVLAVAALACAGSSWAAGGPLIRDPNGPIGTLVVVNQSGQTVTSVLLSDCDSSTYGLNRLPEGTRLESGQEVEFRVSAGCWSLLVGNGGAELRNTVHVPPGTRVNFTVAPS
jgi:hypothetical protein